jgi:hypothetical protein
LFYTSIHGFKNNGIVRCRNDSRRTNRTGEKQVSLTIGITIQKTFGSGFMCGLFVGAIVTLIFLLNDGNRKNDISCVCGNEVIKVCRKLGGLNGIGEVTTKCSQLNRSISNDCQTITRWICKKQYEKDCYHAHIAVAKPDFGKHTIHHGVCSVTDVVLPP